MQRMYLQELKCTSPPPDMPLPQNSAFKWFRRQVTNLGGSMIFFSCLKLIVIANILQCALHRAKSLWIAFHSIIKANPMIEAFFFSSRLHCRWGNGSTEGIHRLPKTTRFPGAEAAFCGPRLCPSPLRSTVSKQGRRWGSTEWSFKITFRSVILGL